MLPRSLWVREQSLVPSQAGNYAQVMKWFLRVAEQGDANAQYNLVLMYSKGGGATQSVAVSFFMGTILAHFRRVVRKRSGLEG